MFRLFCIFLYSVIFSTYAVSSDNYKCHSSNNTMDGWEFLQNGSKIDMVKRTFNMSANISCMSSTTIGKDNSMHTALQLVSYYNWSSSSWMNGTQNLTAYNNGLGKYYFMNTTYTLGPVNTSYEFLYVEQNCTVVNVTYLYANTTGASPESVQSATNYSSCALWVRDNDLGNNHTCCEEVFKNNCTGQIYNVYNRTQCDSLNNNPNKS
uniref:Putative secreted protein n=1 Tax=Amblyomma americanum TaxID=6943 RepID=A0A0C9SE94_AMBAM